MCVAELACVYLSMYVYMHVNKSCSPQKEYN